MGLCETQGFEFRALWGEAVLLEFCGLVLRVEGSEFSASLNPKPSPETLKPKELGVWTFTEPSVSQTSDLKLDRPLIKVFALEVLQMFLGALLQGKPQSLSPEPEAPHLHPRG